jgi:uncharacterized protein YcbX
VSSAFTNDVAPDVELTLSAILIYPVKGCAGISVDAARLGETGLEGDREWMVVDAAGHAVTQSDLPRMALIQVSLSAAVLRLTAPGLQALEVPVNAPGASVSVRVWDDTVSAIDAGASAARWLHGFLGRELRLVRIAPGHERVVDQRYTGPVPAHTAFADEFPLLITSQASLAELNRRLAERGDAAASMLRFRPNLVLDGLDAHGEDPLDVIAFDTPDGPVRLKVVKPCVRCSVPDVDPTTGVQGHAVGDTLAAYRADARADGGITFGMYAVVVDGLSARLRTGQAGGATFRFD